MWLGWGGGLLDDRSRKVMSICGKITSNRFQSLIGKSQRNNEWMLWVPSPTQFSPLSYFHWGMLKKDKHYAVIRALEDCYYVLIPEEGKKKSSVSFVSHSLPTPLPPREKMKIYTSLTLKSLIKQRKFYVWLIIHYVNICIIKIIVNHFLEQIYSH